MDRRPNSSLRIRNALLRGASERLVDIEVLNGKILAVEDSGVGRPSTADAELDVEGRSVLPGLIDPHVHLGNGSQSLTDDIASESRMAVAGGTTTMMPYIVARDDYGSTMSEFHEAVEGVSQVDMLPQLAIVVPEQIQLISELFKRYGVKNFKCFMGYKGSDQSPSGISGLSDIDIYRAMQEVAQIDGGRLAVHCENMEFIDHARSRPGLTDRHDVSAWTESRPLIAEYQAIASAISYARTTGCSLCIPHISFGQGLEHLKAFAAGLDVVFETCPHYLALCSEDKLGVWGKVNPPLRGSSERLSLWRQLVAGTIDMIGTDHCPFSPSTKGNDLWSARPGVPNGPAVSLSILLDGPTSDESFALGWEAVERLTATSPARAYGLSGRKGMIAPGLDADLLVVDPGARRAFSSPLLGGVATNSPYDGLEMSGQTFATIARGEIVFFDEEFFPRSRPAQVLSCDPGLPV